ncbi:MAG: hypothetical protein JWO45_909 [Spartobacteria bacterium]|nr:hypothetical protein [Spartobacteria bacterium]
MIVLEGRALSRPISIRLKPPLYIYERFRQFALRARPAIPILPGFLTLSSSGLGHRPFTAVTRVRIPLGSLPLSVGEIDLSRRFNRFRQNCEHRCSS